MNYFRLRSRDLHGKLPCYMTQNSAATKHTHRLTTEHRCCSTAGWKQLKHSLADKKSFIKVEEGRRSERSLEINVFVYENLNQKFVSGGPLAVMLFCYTLCYALDADPPFPPLLSLLQPATEVSVKIVHASSALVLRGSLTL